MAIIILIVIIQIGVITVTFLGDDTTIFKTKGDVGRWYLYGLVPLLPAIILIVNKLRMM